MSINDDEKESERSIMALNDRDPLGIAVPIGHVLLDDATRKFSVHTLGKRIRKLYMGELFPKVAKHLCNTKFDGTSEV